MSSVPTEDRLGELLLRWDELRRQGRDLPAGELCVDCPELVDELRRRIEVVRRLEPVLDVEPTDLVVTPGGGGPDGSVSARRLPDDLHATAVYRPQRYHAQGGLGEVLAARQEELDRTVALKRIRPDKLHDEARRRFLREAMITARLQHPGIVPIYGLGRDEDGPFYTMPLIEGRTLQEAIDAFHGDEPLRRDPGRRALGFRGLLQQFIAVCNTMAYAHDRGVIHRDLKPSNIMLGPYGETLVMDWGLAKRVGTDDAGGEVDGDAPSPSPLPQDLTAAGAVLGTPHYMSPEQARGEPTSPASDVFSLGLVLYAILIGKSPYADAVLQGGDLLQAVRGANVVSPRSRDASLPRALEAVCLKAMAVQPGDRYPSARALADDVIRWLADEPVSVWREPLSARALRWSLKHRKALAYSTAIVIVSLIGFFAVLEERYQRYAEASALLSEGTAAIERDDFKEAQIYFDQALRQAEGSRFVSLRNLMKGETFRRFGGNLWQKVDSIWNNSGLEGLERTVQFKAKLSDKIATTRGRAQALLDRSENLRFRLIGLGEDLPGAVGELKDLLDPFFVLTSKDDWTKLAHFWEQLNEKQRRELRHEVNELLFLWMVRIEPAIREPAESAARSRPAIGAASHSATLDQALDVCDRALSFAETTGPWKALRALLEAQKAAGDSIKAPAGEAGDHVDPAPELLDEPSHVASRKSASECFQWGLLNSNLGRRRRALEWLQRAARLDWPNYWYQFYLAYLEDQAELSEEALGHYNVAVARQPDSPWALFSRARLYRAKGMWSWALDDFREARRLMGERPESFRVGLDLGYLHQALGDFAAARSEYKSIIRKSPRSDYTRAARLNLANIDAESGNVDRARAEYESLLAEDSQDETTRFSRALLYLRRGEIKQAEADLDMILGLGPLVAKRHEILATRAVARLLQRQTTEATADAAEAQRLKPCPPYERLWQRSLLAAGRYGELQFDRPEEISLLPVGGAWLASDLRSADKKLSLLARGPQPQATRALLNRAVVLAALGDRQAAARVADQVLELTSLSPRAHLICARVFHHVGDRSRALREIELGQALQSDEPGLLELRAVLRIEAGDAKKAIVDLNRAIAGSPHNFTFLHKAAALVALGNHEGAVHEWTMALNLDPELPQAFLGRAWCFGKLGLWEQALADLEQASARAHNDLRLQLSILITYASCVVERPEQTARWVQLLRGTTRLGWDLMTQPSVPAQVVR